MPPAVVLRTTCLRTSGLNDIIFIRCNFAQICSMDAPLLSSLNLTTTNLVEQSNPIPQNSPKKRVTNPVEQISTTPQHRPRKRGTQDWTPRKVKLNNRLRYVTQTKAKNELRLKKKIGNLKARLNEQSSKELRRLKCDIRRKKISILGKNEQIKTLKSDLLQNPAANESISKLNMKEIKKLEKQYKNVLKQKQVFKRRNKSAKKNCLRLQAQVKLKDAKIKRLQAELRSKEVFVRELQSENSSVLQLTANASKADASMLEKNQQYPLLLRTIVYDLLTSNVPTASVPSILESMTKRCQLNWESIPKRPTVENMAREIGIIASYQAAEFMLESKNLTLSFDATTQEGVHVNSVHVTSKDQCLIIAVDELPGGTADDYANHVNDSIDHLAQVFSSFNESNFQSIRNDIISSVSNTITDRAVVNHAAISKLELAWGKSLNQLNCHLHPLDTIATKCKGALKDVENDLKKTDRNKFETRLGKVNESMAGGILWNINKARYKDGTGDPKGFVNALIKNGLPKGYLPRYRGNRLHVLFHISGKLFYKSNVFIDFLTSGSMKSGKNYFNAIAHDFKNNITKLELQVLGLLGKLLTGPWMQIFYKPLTRTSDASCSSNLSDITNIGGIKLIQTLVSNLKTYEPSKTLTAETDFFGNNLSVDDEIFQALQQKPTDPTLFNVFMDKCLKATVAVLERQYKRHFATDFSADLELVTESARTHNIDAEQMMGMFSACKQRAPNATLSFISAKIRAQKNKTTQYLDEIADEKRKNLVQFSVKERKKLAMKTRRKMKEIQDEISKRIAARKQRMLTKERKEIEKILLEENWRSNIQRFGIDVTQNEFDQTSKILAGDIIGCRFCQVWFDQNTQKETRWYGKVEKLSKKTKNNKKIYRIAYWTDEDRNENNEASDPYENAEDYDLVSTEIAVDYLCGELIFC